MSRIQTTGPTEVTSDWSGVHLPAANTIATSTIAAPGAGRRLVITRIEVGLVASSAAPSAKAVSVSITDNATGTVIWGVVLAVPATAGASTGLIECPVWIGQAVSVNGSITLAFSASGGANTVESVSWGGVTVLA